MTVATLPPPTSTQAAAPAGGADAPDWARAVLERQLWILGQLAEGGLEIARAIERKATGAGSDETAPAGVTEHIPMAYARVARAVRMTILLQSKVIEAIQELDGAAARKAFSARVDRDVNRPRLVREQKNRIGRIIGRMAWADDHDGERAGRLAREAVERLEQDELYGDILTRPFSEIIALLCKDMGLEPDWPQLAEEAWAKAEIAGGRAAGPLAAAPARSAPANDQHPLEPHAASP